MNKNITVAEKYISFLNFFGRSDKDNYTEELDSLFSPNVQKVVNERTICTNLEKLFAQMNEVKKTYGLKSINVFEIFVDGEKNSDILRWEISYKDDTTESVITILKYNTQGLIVEINEVFGEKEIYKWPENENRLIAIAKQYLTFVHDVGSVKSINATDERIKTLFAENLTKIDNHVVLFENNRNSLLPQMTDLKKNHTSPSNKADWTVDLENALIIPSIETNSVIINFQGFNIHLGQMVITAILKCNENNQIERITDVSAKI